MVRLGPTTPGLDRDDAKPYFLFWTDATVADLRAHLAFWPRLVRYLGRSRSMWAYLLQLPDLPWPPPDAHA